jgi:hypothetical protein
MNKLLLQHLEFKILTQSDHLRFQITHKYNLLPYQMPLHSQNVQNNLSERHLFQIFS